MKTTTINEIIAWAEGASRLAVMLNVDRAAVSQWRRHGRVPPRRAIQIEQLSLGRFRAVDIAQTAEEE